MYYTYEEVDKCVIKDEVGYRLAKQVENVIETNRYLKENLHGVKEGENKKLDDRYRKLITRVANLDNNSLRQVDKLDDNL